MAAAVSHVFAPTSSEAHKYQAILQRKIDEGARKAGAVMHQIHAQQPTDQIASTRAVRFEPTERSVNVVVGDLALAPSAYALGQIASRGNVPAGYLRELVNGEHAWQRELAVEVLSKHYGNADAERLLVRSVNGQLRGWLSDRYRRLDSRPLTEALNAECDAIGAVPVDGVATETRVALKVLLPEIIEPIPGEYMVRGAEWSNSDFGNGTHSFRTFALRVVCLNGMTRENVLREIHLGGRLSDNVAYSERTYQLDTDASVSALRDVVRGVLGPASQDAFVASIRKSHETSMGTAALRAATRNVGKETQKSIVDAFESSDVINLPAGNTAWRASNAISWIARHTEDAEKRLDLERLAGAVA